MKTNREKSCSDHGSCLKKKTDINSIFIIRKCYRMLTQNIHLVALRMPLPFCSLLFLLQDSRTEADKPQRLLRSELAAPASLHRRGRRGEQASQPAQSRPETQRDSGKGKSSLTKEEEHLSSAFPLVPVGEGIPATPLFSVA